MNQKSTSLFISTNSLANNLPKESKASFFETQIASSQSSDSCKEGSPTSIKCLDAPILGFKDSVSTPSIKLNLLNSAPFKITVE